MGGRGGMWTRGRWGRGLLVRRASWHSLVSGTRSDLVGFLWNPLVKKVGWELKGKELWNGHVTLEKSFNLSESVSC